MSDRRSPARVVRLRRPDLWVAVGLALLTLAAFEGVARCGFVSYDDPEYVTRNPMVLAGLTWRGLAWAFATGHAGNWHPLTWISHMLDVELFGLRPLGHHATSVALHVANTLVVFFALARATQTRWRSALAAGLFALHPLRVESVVWVAERKDLLCALFFLLALVAWGRHARGARRGYGLTLAAGALALAAKPMAVTLPFALVIADRWPLRRGLPFRKLVFEKLPFFALAAASSALTLGVQLSAGASEPWAQPSLLVRLAFVPVAYLRYLELTLWPANLAVLHPHPGAALGAVEVGVAIGVLAAVTALALAQARSRPWLLAGWLWFGVTLTPVIGLVHIGFHGVAERYTYLPSLGLAVAVAFGAGELAERLRFPRALRAALAAGALGALLVLTHRQVDFWKDGFTLYQHTLAVTESNFAIQAFIADELADAGRRDEAIAHYGEALRIRPDFPHAHYGLGVMYEEQGDDAGAIASYRAALRANPDFVQAHFNLANLLGRAGEIDEAVAHYQRVLELEPEHAGARQGLAIARQLGAPR